MPEDDRTKWTHHEARPEDAERVEETLAQIAGKELRREEPGEHAVQVEIVELDQRAAGRRGNDEGEAVLPLGRVTVTGDRDRLSAGGCHESVLSLPVR